MKKILLIAVAVTTIGIVKSENIVPQISLSNKFYYLWTKFKNFLGLEEFNHFSSIEDGRRTNYEFGKNYTVEEGIEPKLFAAKGNVEFALKNMNAKAVSGLVRKARHEGRSEVKRKAMLVGTGIAGIYGLYQLYNWYRGDLHALKQHIKAAQASINKAIKIAAKEKDKDSNILTSIGNAYITLETIYQSIEKEENRRKNTK